MNAQIKTSIPDVNLAPVAAADPLWPVNLAHHADLPANAQTIPANAGRSLDILFNHPQ
jgi:hypothetical protein